MEPIYLDYAAATPMDSRVLEAMMPYFADNFYNPSALYGSARQVADELLRARQTVAHHVGARPAEITFTAGGTEANNLAVSGVMLGYPGSKLVVSTIEHDSVLEVAKRFGHSIAPVDAQGIIDVKALGSLIDDQTVLISCMYANNEIGTIQPLREIGGLIKQIRADRRARSVSLPLIFHTDAAQAGNYLDIHAARLGVDLMTLNGGKLYGPKQSGALFVKGGVALVPLLHGGGQEHSLRSGTENMAGVVGLAKALDIAQQMRHDESRRLQELQKIFMERLADLLPHAIRNGSRHKRLPNNVHVTFPGMDNERLIIALDEAGIQAAAGSACSASKETTSHVLLALGISDADARASVRFTMGRQTTREDVMRTVDVLRQLVAA